MSDIDCVPASNEWSKILSKKINANIDIVLGYGAYKKLKGFLNKCLRFECVMTAIQYMSYAKTGMPYMGVGRNLCYKKSLFRSAGGFKNHLDIPSGDDDLFIQAVAKSNNTAIALESDSFTISDPPRSWFEYFRQKTRHISTSAAYSVKSKLFLAIFATAHILFYVTFVCALFLECRGMAILSYLSFVIVVWSIFIRLANLFEEQDLKFWFPVLDIFYFFYFLLLTPFVIIRRKKW